METKEEPRKALVAKVLSVLILRRAREQNVGVRILERISRKLALLMTSNWDKEELLSSNVCAPSATKTTLHIFK